MTTSGFDPNDFADIPASVFPRRPIRPAPRQVAPLPPADDTNDLPPTTDSIPPSTSKRVPIFTQQSEAAPSPVSSPHPACPRLGLAHDPATRALFVSDDHRCGADPSFVPAGEHQQAYCLTANYLDCAHYAATGSAGPAPPMAERPPAERAPVPRRKRRSRTAVIVGATAIAALLVVGAVVVTDPFGSDSSPGSGSSASAAASGGTSDATDDSDASGDGAGGDSGDVSDGGTPVVVGAAPVAPVRPTEAATSEPTPTPTATPTEEPTEEPADDGPPLAAEAEPYIIEDGDSLSSIANARGVPLDDLLALNDLTLDDTILIGQSLLIPTTRLGP